jgi:hypothetical protein
VGWVGRSGRVASQERAERSRAPRLVTSRTVLVSVTGVVWCRWARAGLGDGAGGWLVRLGAARAESGSADARSLAEGATVRAARNASAAIKDRPRSAALPA